MEKKNYKNAIIRMMNDIENVEFLKRIYRLTYYIWKK